MLLHATQVSKKRRSTSLRRDGLPGLGRKLLQKRERWSARFYHWAHGKEAKRIFYRNLFGQRGGGKPSAAKTEKVKTGFSSLEGIIEEGSGPCPRMTCSRQRGLYKEMSV